MSGFKYHCVFVLMGGCLGYISLIINIKQVIRT